MHLSSQAAASCMYVSLHVSLHGCRSAEAQHGVLKSESPEMDAMLMTSMTQHLPEVQA